MSSSRAFLVTVTFLAMRVVALGDDGAGTGVAFFEKRIRPVLIRHCYECHSAASTELKGGLRLDSRDLIRKGGESGAAVVPKSKKKSLLLQAIRYESFKMPPDKRLSRQVVADFEKWIEIGAPDPRDRPPSAKEVAELSWRVVLNERRHWWSLRPVVAAKPPRSGLREGADHPIDAFIFARQRAAGIKAGKSASARLLARRLSLVLTGLPPEPRDVEQFVRDSARDPRAAYERLVDRLLSSPHFGEHWARHWMDVVRFAETHGYEWNHEIRDAWRYRDYLIRAFNGDVPYNQLIREHIAGDLLKTPRLNKPLGVNESIIGTAFWRFGELGHDDCVEFPEIRFDALDNQIDTLGKAFQGLTISCARCHDHKLDAISSNDYYALVGILESCSQVVHTIDSPQRVAVAMRRTKQLKSQIRQQLGTTWLSAIDRSRDTIMSAITADPKVARNSKGLTRYLANEKQGREDPGYLLRRVARRDANARIATLWKELHKEYTAEQNRRAKSNAENFEVWADFRPSDKSVWSAGGLGLMNGPTRAGEFTLTHKGESIVAAILPAGFYTNVTSDRLNGTLRSPWLTTRKKYISLQLVGDGRSMVRAVVDSCALNEFAGGGLEYLAGGALKWKRFPTSAGGAHRSFIELTTRSDNPRWPDRPGRAGTSDPKELRSLRSSFGVMRAVLHDSPTAPLPELSPILALFKEPQPARASDVVTVFQSVARKAVIAWKEGRATNADVHWINWLLKAGLLPNSVQGNEQLSGLLKRYREVAFSIPEPRVVAGLADHGTGKSFPLLQGGDPTKPGAVVPRRYLEVISGHSKPFPSNGSGRRQLAEIIASSSNPLTARVMVNRVWHHLFGRGIVATTDDFGRMGDKPTHPQLLDYLAERFVEDDWSIKRLIRRIILSRTFRQSSLPDGRAMRLDPGNRLLHHYPARRLGAESLRDTILAVSGRMDAKLFGASIHPHRKEAKDYRKLLIGPLDGAGRRSIYTKVTRMEGPQFLELFDFPNPMATRGRRDRTNVPAQALALLNDPFVVDQARFWAARLVAADDKSIEKRVHRMFHRALGRAPSHDEQRRFVTLIRQLADNDSATDAAILKNRSVWQDAAHAVFNLKELIYIR